MLCSKATSRHLHRLDVSSQVRVSTRLVSTTCCAWLQVVLKHAGVVVGEMIVADAGGELPDCRTLDAAAGRLTITGFVAAGAHPLLPPGHCENFWQAQRCCDAVLGTPLPRCYHSKSFEVNGCALILRAGLDEAGSDVRIVAPDLRDTDVGFRAVTVGLGALVCATINLPEGLPQAFAFTIHRCPDACHNRSCGITADAHLLGVLQLVQHERLAWSRHPAY
jgi:hypothetical protein